jgi:hypothetical protein
VAARPTKTLGLQKIAGQRFAPKLLRRGIAPMPID